MAFRLYLAAGVLVSGTNPLPMHSRPPGAARRRHRVGGQQDVVRELIQYRMCTIPVRAAFRGCMDPVEHANIRDADTMPSYPSRVISAHARGYPTKQTRSAQHAMISRTLVLLTMVGEAQHNSYIHTEYSSPIPSSRDLAPLSTE